MRPILHDFLLLVRIAVFFERGHRQIQAELVRSELLVEEEPRLIHTLLRRGSLRSVNYHLLVLCGRATAVGHLLLLLGDGRRALKGENFNLWSG